MTRPPFSSWTHPPTHPPTHSSRWAPIVRCRFLFNKIVEDEYSDWFYDPVDTDLYSDYLSYVTTPMCLSQIKVGVWVGGWRKGRRFERAAVGHKWVGGWAG